jgi:hypothetical protein
MWRVFWGFLGGLNLGFFLADGGLLNLIAAVGMAFIIYFDWRLSLG